MDKADRLPNSPYPTPTIGGALLEPLRDEFYENEVYVWYKLVEGGPDLDLELIDQDRNGQPPRWWEDDLENGWGVEYQLMSWAPGAHRLRWAMENGLIHEQPFAMRIGKPEWFRCSYEYDEWDFNADLDIVRVEAPRFGLRDFERILAEIVAWPIWSNKRRAENDRARWAMTSRMYIRTYPYFAPGQSTWDEMTMPNGLAYRLCSSLQDVDQPEQRGCWPLVEGRSDTGNCSEALEQLSRKVAERRPDLTLDKLKQLRRWSW